MAKLTYTAITSLDGYIEDESGGFDWAAPDPEVHAFVNDLERPVGTCLYGRRGVRVRRRFAFWPPKPVSGHRFRGRERMGVGGPASTSSAAEAAATAFR
jgi:hypothetical protein